MVKRFALILDLSCHGLSARAAYVREVMQALIALRARRGRPHWFLIDEIHSFCPREGGPLTALILSSMKEGGFALVSFRPSLVAPALLEAIDHWLLTRLYLPEEIEVVEHLTGVSGPHVKLTELPVGQAYLHLGVTTEEETPDAGVVAFKRGRRVVPHVRQLHKYLRAPLPESKQFYFHVNGQEAGPRVAASL